jgi:hypothetical protein
MEIIRIIVPKCNVVRRKSGQKWDKFCKGRSRLFVYCVLCYITYIRHLLMFLIKILFFLLFFLLIICFFGFLFYICILLIYY